MSLVIPCPRMHAGRSIPLLGLLFALFCATSSLGRAASIEERQGPIFDLRPELEVADARLELAQNPPRANRKAVEAELKRLRRSWSEAGPSCRDASSAPKNLLQTKIYLQGILRRLAAASRLESRFNTEYGVCVTVIEQPQGIFANLLAGPRLNQGVIQIAPKFLLEFNEEDELAYVLAHELSHFLLKHEIMYAYMNGTGRGLEGISVLSEREADELGMRILINAGYDVQKALDRLKQMRAQDSSHFWGSQLDDLRRIVLVDLEKTKRTYDVIPSEPYLPRAVRVEIQNYLSQPSAGL